MNVTEARQATLAVAQLPVVTGNIDDNVERALKTISAAGAQGVDLIVFPESFLSGYVFNSREAAVANAVSAGDARLAIMADACRAAGTYAVVGYLESAGSAVYNSAITLGPGGVLGNYRKQHLPYLGVDRFVDPGDGSSSRIVDTPFGRVGVMVCFDLRFPESARELALKGADVIAMPTNWPVNASFLADHMTRVRAAENLVYLAVADRPDRENGAEFIGRSQIIAPSGDVLTDAGTSEGIFTASVDLNIAQTKHLTVESGSYELSIFEGRRPEQYGELVKPIRA